MKISKNFAGLVWIIRLSRRLSALEDRIHSGTRTCFANTDVTDGTRSGRTGTRPQVLMNPTRCMELEGGAAQCSQRFAIEFQITKDSRRYSCIIAMLNALWPWP